MVGVLSGFPGELVVLVVLWVLRLLPGMREQLVGVLVVLVGLLVLGVLGLLPGTGEKVVGVLHDFLGLLVVLEVLLMLDMQVEIGVAILFCFILFYILY